MWNPAAPPHREHLDEAKTRPILRGKKIGAVIVPVLLLLARRNVPSAKRNPRMFERNLVGEESSAYRIGVVGHVFVWLASCWHFVVGPWVKDDREIASHRAKRSSIDFSDR
jgi:hypothetical protein